MRILLLLISAMVLMGCSMGKERALLPLRDTPQREAVRDVPPDGIIMVEPGDTIYTVANRYQVTPRRIILSNQLAPPYDLTGLTTISIPKPRGHPVRQGDTLDSISRRYRVSKADLITRNALEPPYSLRPGMEIAIPRKLDYSSLDASAFKSSGASGSGIGRKAVKPKTPIRDVKFSETASDFTWPVNGSIVERFGVAAKGVHNDGVNIAATPGAPVRASLGGEVAFVGSGLKSFGNLVLIKHQDGWITAYAHLGEVSVKEGQSIKKGTVIGAVGQSGKVDSPQLHFELRKSRQPVNPEDYLS